MGKLTLQELSAYLPWGLEAKLSKIGIFNLDSEYPNEHKDKICTITDYGFMNGDFYGQMKVNDSKYSFDFDSLDEIDILLLPLSHLTKPINHKGEEFVPIERLIKDLQFYHHITLSGLFKDNNGEYFNIDEIPYNVVQKLHEWHFDTFGLIERGLAIDKSTI